MNTTRTVTIYVYDIFEKEESNRIIDFLNHHFGNYKSYGNVYQSFFGGDGISEEVKKWKVTDLSSSITVIQQIQNESRFKTDLTKSRESVTELNFFVVNNPILPYLILMLSISVNKNKIADDNFFHDINDIARTFRIYFESLKGISTTLNLGNPVCPCFVNMIIETTKEELASMGNLVNILYTNKQYIEQPSQFDIYLKTSATFREIFPLNSLGIGLILLSVCSKMANSISIVGNLMQFGLGGLFTNFMVTFSTDDETENEIIPTANPSPYELMGFSNGGLGTLVYLTSMKIWIMFMAEKVKSLNNKFTILRKKLKNISPSINIAELKNYLFELHTIGSEFDQVKVDMSEESRNVEYSIQNYLSGKGGYNEETPILPDSRNYFHNKDFFERNQSKGNYLRMFALDIKEIIKQLNYILDQYSEENKIITTRFNDIVSLKNQATISEQSRVTLTASIIIGLLTAIMLYRLF